MVAIGWLLEQKQVNLDMSYKYGRAAGRNVADANLLGAKVDEGFLFFVAQVTANTPHRVGGVP